MKAANNKNLNIIKVTHISLFPPQPSYPPHKQEQEAMEADSDEEEVYFYFEYMTEPELRQWEGANPGGLNGKNARFRTPLCAAVEYVNSAPLIL